MACVVDVFYVKRRVFRFVKNCVHCCMSHICADFTEYRSGIRRPFRSTMADEANHAGSVQITKSANLTGRVLVLGRGVRAFLATIRSLSRGGLTVDVAVGDFSDMALRSRHICDKHFLPPYSSDDPDFWLEAMEEILASGHYDLVIPCTDDVVVPVQLHASRLSQLTTLCLINQQAHAICNSKDQSAELMKGIGCPVPQGQVVDVGAPTAEFVSGRQYPLIIKPLQSVSEKNAARKLHVVRVRNAVELDAFRQQAQDWGQVLVQANFNGEGIGIEILAFEGKVLHAFQHCRIHEPLEGGGSSYRRSEPLHKEMFDVVRRAVRKLEYTGVAMFEFKHNRSSGLWTFIEINPRLWGSLPLSVASGSDFPLWWCQMLLQGRREFPAGYRSHRSRNLLPDLYWIVDNITADRTDPTLATRPLWTIPIEMLNFIIGRESIDSFSWHDMRPFFQELREIGQALRDRLGRAIGIRDDRWTRGHRRNQKSTIETILRAQHILVICKGNICRSPFLAEVMKNRLGDGREIQSAGYYQAQNRQTPIAGIEAGSQLGVDLSAHRSRVLNPEMVQWADAILFFDRENRGHLQRAYRESSSKFIPFGMICNGNTPYVSDPYGNREEGFAACYRQILSGVQKLHAE